MKNEKGSILISTLLFVSITAILVSGLASIVQSQVTQLKQVQYSYQARSMISMTETVLQNEYEKNNQLKEGKIWFNIGVVDVKKQTDTLFILNAALDHDYSMTREFEIKSDTSDEKIKQE